MHSSCLLLQAAELPHSSASVNEMLASIDFDNNNEMDEREWRTFICAQVGGWWMGGCLGMQTGQIGRLTKTFMWGQ